MSWRDTWQGSACRKWLPGNPPCNSCNPYYPAYNPLCNPCNPSNPPYNPSNPSNPTYNPPYNPSNPFNTPYKPYNLQRIFYCVIRINTRNPRVSWLCAKNSVCDWTFLYIKKKWIWNCMEPWSRGSWMKTSCIVCRISKKDKNSKTRCVLFGNPGREQ